MLEYKTVSALCRAAEESGSAISALVLADQASSWSWTHLRSTRAWSGGCR